MTEERNAVVNYLDSYFIWAEHFTNMTLGGVDIYDNESIDKFSVKLLEVTQKFLSDEIKFTLFVENERLRELATKLKLQASTLYAKPMTEYIFSCKKINNNLKFIPTTISYEMQTKKREELNAQMMECVNQFSESVKKNNRELYPLAYGFLNECRAYIYKLLKSK